MKGHRRATSRCRGIGQGFWGDLGYRKHQLLSFGRKRQDKIIGVEMALRRLLDILRGERLDLADLCLPLPIRESKKFAIEQQPRRLPVGLCSAWQAAFKIKFHSRELFRTDGLLLHAFDDGEETF